MSTLFSKSSCKGIPILINPVKEPPRMTHPLDKILGREPTIGEKFLFDEGRKYERAQ